MLTESEYEQEISDYSSRIEQNEVCDLFAFFKLLKEYYLIFPSLKINSTHRYLTYNSFYDQNDNIINLGTEIDNKIQERILNVRHILNICFMLSKNIHVSGYLCYSGSWIKCADKINYSSDIIIFEDCEDLPRDGLKTTKDFITNRSRLSTIIYDNRDINKNNYTEGISLREYFKNHTHEEFLRELENIDEHTGNSNYSLECLKIATYLMKGKYENIVYVAKGLLQDDRDKKYENLVLFGNLEENIKLSLLISPADFTGASYIALNHINNIYIQPSKIKQDKNKTLTIWC